METQAALLLPESSNSARIILWGVFWQPQLPHLHKDKWPVLCQAPKRYRDAFTLLSFERSCLSRPKQMVPMAKHGQLRVDTKTSQHLSTVNPSGSWLSLSFEIPLVNCTCTRPLGVKHAHDGCVPSMFRGFCARTRLGAGLQREALYAFHVLAGESSFLPVSPAVACFLQTILTLAYGTLSP